MFAGFSTGPLRQPLEHCSVNWRTVGLGVEVGAGVEVGNGVEVDAGVEVGNGVEVDAGVEVGADVAAGRGVAGGAGVAAGRGVAGGAGVATGAGVGVHAPNNESAITDITANIARLVVILTACLDIYLPVRLHFTHIWQLHHR